MSFDPNAAASPDAGIFGLPCDERESALVLVPVPWEATTSYGGGTSNGPQSIFEASHQVDLFDIDVLRPYEAGIHLLPEATDVRAWNERARAQAEAIIEVGGQIGDDPGLKAKLNDVNSLGENLNAWVEAETERLLRAGKIVGIVGGDHSVPFGAIRAMARREPGLGILHFDAHSDTRKAYEGFTWSHASIMYNVLERIPEVSRLVQVGIRDFCEEELEYVESQKDRAKVHFDAHLAAAKFGGESWDRIADRIVADLPKMVWVSFDIDGLDPRFCPNTGTPVPGGLDFNEAIHILRKLARSGRQIVGFDLNEVSPGEGGGEWDANVGARLLYKLVGFTLASQGRVKFR